MANTNQFKITGINSDTGVAGDGITSDNTLIVKGSAATNGGSVNIFLNGTLIGTFTAPANGAAWSFDYTSHPLADGDYTIHAVDVTSGASVDYAIRIDTSVTAPTVALTSDTGSSNSDHITNNGALTVSGLETGATVQYSTNGGSTWSSTFAAVEGSNTVLVRQTDLAGNVSTGTSFSFTLDTTAPSAPSVSLSSDTGTSGIDHITNSGALAVTGLESGATVQYSTDGGSTWSTSFTATEGTNNVLVHQKDVAGNVSANASFSFTLDTAAPSAPTVALAHDSGASSSDGITNNGALTVGGTESGATVEYSVDGGTTWSASFTATEGANNVLVHQTDVAGNVSGTSSLAFTLDTVAPDAPTVTLAHDTGTSSSDHITSNGTLHVSGLENGATVEYSIDGGNTWAGSFTASEGSNTVQVRQTDAAGNVGTSQSLSFTLDTVAPDAPTIALTSDSGSSNSDGITNNGSVDVKGIESGASVQYSVDGGSTWSNDFTATEGVNHVLVRQSDAAGNTSDAASLNFTLDTTAPDAPVIALAHDTGTSGSDGITNNGTITVDNTESGATVEYSIDGGTTWSGSFTAAEGSNSVLVHQVDVAGNIGANASLSFTLDTIAPDAPSVTLNADSGTSNSDHITNNGALDVNGLENGAAVEYSVDGGNTWTNSFTAAEGKNNVLVHQVDVAGNVSTYASLSFTLDTIAPDAPAVALTTDSGSSQSDGITNDGTLNVTGIESDAKVEYSVDGGSTWTGSFTAAEGSNTVLVRQTDVAGNASTTSSLSFTLDTTAPNAPTVALVHDTGTSGSDGITSNGTLDVSNIESGAKVEYSIDGGTTWSDSFTATEGGNTVTVRQTDLAGNVGASASVSFTLDTTAPNAPVVTLTTDSGTSGSDGITKVGTLAVSGLESGASVEYSIDNGSTWSTSFTATEGSNTVLVRQSDVAGNASTAASLSFTLDTIAPVAPAIALATDSGSSHTDGITNNGTLAMTGLESGATVEYSTDGGSTWTSSFNAVEGSNTVLARQTDLAGNTSATSNLSFTLDTIAPTAPTVALAVDTGISNSDHITSNGTINVSGLESGATVQYSIDGGNTWTGSFTAVEGSNNLQVRETDVAGNIGAASSLSFVLDTTATAATFATAQLNGNSSTMTMGGTTEANSVVTIYDLTTGKVAGTATANGSGAWTFTTGKVSGIHAFNLSSTDAAGNVGHSTAEAIIGTMGAEAIRDVAGQNDILSGAQGLDTFVFGAGFGNDVITDFIPGNGTHEMIQFSKASFASFTALMSHAQQVGANVVIADGAGDSLTLIGINIADLKAVDFAFV